MPIERGLTVTVILSILQVSHHVMSEIKFSCPGCEQHLEADQSYAGTQIACPTCQVPFTIPDNIIVTAAPPPVRAPARVLAVASSAGHLVPSAPQQEASACPSCGVGMARGALLCVQCGYNLSTKKRMVAGQAVAPGKPSSDQWETPWYQTALPYVGALVVVLGLLYMWGRTNERAMIAFAGIGGVYCLVIHIAVVVAAFKEGSGTGMLALCVPFYALYFVFKEESPTLKILYCVAIVVNVCIRMLVKN
jgi:hypothetical protein